MKRVVFFTWIFCIQIACATEPIYISLGDSCMPTFSLRALQLRLRAYPFDWVISPFEGMYAALQDDFSKYFTDLRLFPDETGTIDHYGISFHHDWHIDLSYNDSLNSIDWKSKIPFIREKYNRRIERFIEACNSEDNIVFIRFRDIDKDKSIKLRDLIRSKYPRLKFILMVVKFSEEFQEPWGIESIKNFSIIDYDYEKWGQAFKEVSSEFCHIETQ